MEKLRLRELYNFPKGMQLLNAAPDISLKFRAASCQIIGFYFYHNTVSGKKDEDKSTRVLWESDIGKNIQK